MSLICHNQNNIKLFNTINPFITRTSVFKDLTVKSVIIAIRHSTIFQKNFLKNISTSHVTQESANFEAPKLQICISIGTVSKSSELTLS